MLKDWLGGTDLDRFRSQALGVRPFAVPASAGAARVLLDWDVIDRVLADGVEIQALNDGRKVEAARPETQVDVRAFLRAGIGLCLRRAERHDPRLARLAETFAQDLGPTHVNIFVTAAGTHGYGWRYSDEDMFYAQVSGVEDFYFRDNTVTRDVAADSGVFSRYPEETSKLCAATLVPGDFLYVPARWWRVALCRETAMTLAIAVDASVRSRGTGARQVQALALEHAGEGIGYPHEPVLQTDTFVTLGDGEDPEIGPRAVERDDRDAADLAIPVDHEDVMLADGGARQRRGVVDVKQPRQLGRVVGGSESDA